MAENERDVEEIVRMVDWAFREGGDFSETVRIPSLSKSQAEDLTQRLERSKYSSRCELVLDTTKSGMIKGYDIYVSRPAR